MCKIGMQIHIEKKSIFKKGQKTNLWPKKCYKWDFRAYFDRL